MNLECKEKQKRNGAEQMFFKTLKYEESISCFSEFRLHVKKKKLCDQQIKDNREIEMKRIQIGNLEWKSKKKEKENQQEKENKRFLDTENLAMSQGNKTITTNFPSKIKTVYVQLIPPQSVVCNSKWVKWRKMSP